MVGNRLGKHGCAARAVEDVGKHTGGQAQQSGTVVGLAATVPPTSRYRERSPMYRFLPFIFALAVLFYDLFVFPYFDLWKTPVVDWTAGTVVFAVIIFLLTIWANGIALWLTFAGVLFSAFTRHRLDHTRSDPQRTRGKVRFWG
jgi:hypothetical protein